MGLFCSNDPATPIGAMVRSIGGEELDAQLARNRVRVKQVFAARKIRPAGNCAFAGSIRSGDDGQDRQLSGSGAR